MRTANASGFTLLEVMISLFILTIIGIIISTGLNSVVRSHEHIEKKLNKLADLQLAMLIIERDMRQMMDRPILDENGRERAALMIDDSRIEFTRGGFINPSAQSLRSTLQRLAYQLNGTTLVRITWSMLDRTQSGELDAQRLLEDVRAFHVTLIRQKTPSVSNPLLNNYKKVGILIEMDIEGMGHLKRLVPLSPGSLGEPLHVAA